MSVDSKLFDTIGALANKNPKNLQADWFTIGFLYAHSLQTKSLDDIFHTVNNITLLSRSNTLTTDETNDILTRMMNNQLNAEKANTNTKPNGTNSVAEPKQGNDNKAAQNGKANNGIIRKSSTIEIEELSDGKTGLIEDLSYKSDDELSPSKNGRKKSAGKGKQDDELLELELTEAEYKALNIKDTTSYVRKPVNQVNLSDLNKPTNLKRPPTMEEEQLSLELIKQLQEEDAKLQKMVEERKKKEEQESSEVTCSICLGSLLDEAFIPLEGCIHIFHEGCFQEYLKSEISSRSFPIKCPSNCGQEVAESDVVQVLDKDLVTKFYEYSLQKYVSTHADEISCCPTPNCTYAFAHENEGEDENVLNCPLCKKTYCLNCRVDFHKGMTCKEYQINNTKDANDLKFEKFVKGKKYKQCSKCKFWVEKNQGCDHMTCRCKYEFCYKCGGKYRECECVKKMQELAQRRAEQRKQNRTTKRRKR